LSVPSPRTRIAGSARRCRLPSDWRAWPPLWSSFHSRGGKGSLVAWFSCASSSAPARAIEIASRRPYWSQRSSNAGTRYALVIERTIRPRPLSNTEIRPNSSGGSVRSCLHSNAPLRPVAITRKSLILSALIGLIRLEDLRASNVMWQCRSFFFRNPAVAALPGGTRSGRR